MPLHSAIESSIELGVIRITTEFKYLKIRGRSIPLGRGFTPLNPFLCKWCG